MVSFKIIFLDIVLIINDIKRNIKTKVNIFKTFFAS